MSNDPSSRPDTKVPARQRYGIHVVLFLLTLLTTSYAGLAFLGPPDALATLESTVVNLPRGLPFSVLLLILLAAHEFGHFIAARVHRVDITLPYFIPMPLLFGTMGAVIRTRSPIPHKRALFDIGVAGPLAGFVIALAYLVIGTLLKPEVSVIHAVHPEYATLQTLPEYGLHFGDFGLFALLRAILVPDGAFFPPMNELYHYPLLAVGWFGMFVTALNLIPIGQLDGGHILYAMAGRHQAAISRWVWRGMLVAGSGGVARMLYEATAGYDPNPTINAIARAVHGPLESMHIYADWWFRGWIGWLIWGVIVRFLIRIAHPPVDDGQPLNTCRIVTGWIAIAIFLLTVSWTGIYDVVPSASILIHHP